MIKKILLTTLSFFIVSSASAFDVSSFILIGYGEYDKKAGAEFGIGLQLRPIERLKLDIAPFTGIFIRKNDPRYTRTKEDKQIVCRDNVSGEVTDRSYCGADFRYAFESSLKVQLFDFLDIGGGARVGDRTLPYGVAVIHFNPSVGLEGKVGDDYTSVVFRCDF